MERRRFLQTGLPVVGAMLTAPLHGDNKPKTKIKVGQIGTTHAHATKLSVYRASADYDVIGVVEPDEALRKQAERSPAFRGVTWLTREQLFNTPGLQAVLVETPVADLLDHATACVNAGFHVHIDKPAGTSLKALQALFDTATKKKLLVQMGYMFRYNPAVTLLRQFLKEGWLGDIFEVHTVMSKVVPPAERKKLAQFKGGIMFELGCHVLDLVIHMLGKPQATTAHNLHSAKLDDGLMDNMLAVLQYPKATASVKASAIEVEGGNRRHLVVAGTEGTFHIQPLDNPSVRLSLSKAHGDYKKGTQDITLPKYTRYVDDAADMAKIIRGEKTTDFSPTHDLTVQETLLHISGMAM